MSTTDTSPDTGVDGEAEEHEHHGPTTKQYIQIFVVLFVLTAMEVAASFVDIGVMFLPTLIGLMLLKFALVAGWFMHLRYDTLIYTRFVQVGLGMAIVLYTVVLLIFSDAVLA